MKIKIKQILMLLLVVLLSTYFCTSTLAQTNWTGTNGISWSDPGNWSAGVPDAADDVTIPNTTNKPTISGGTVAVAKTTEVRSGTTLTIAATASLTLNGSKSGGGGTTAFLNDGTVQNNGQLILGNVSGIGGEGLYNRGTFNNNTGGDIKIDRSTNRAIFNRDATFNNAALITIGALASVGARGLDNFGTTAMFNNNTGGEIKIDNATSAGLNNEGGGTFTNAAKITIGATTSIIGEGIDNRGTFNNNTGGDIKIDRTGRGLLNHTATFNNAALITIGASASVGQRGLNNFGATAVFNNNTGGEIKIDNATSIGLFNESGTFNNVAKITIGATASIGGTGIDNRGTFNNNSCAAWINIVSNSIVTNSGTFSNAGIITERASGNSNISNNSGIVQNLNGGTFTITTNTGVLTTAADDIWTGCISTNWATSGNWADGTVPTAADDVTIPNTTNNPTILGGTAAVAKSIEVRTGVTLTIAAMASLTINGSKSISGNTIALFNSGTVTNSGQVEIGSSSMADVGKYGIRNEGTFTNSGGNIQIDRWTDTGLYNEAGSFTNSGNITIGASAATGKDGLFNRVIFSNTGAGLIQIDRSFAAGISNLFSATFTNSARIIIGSLASVGNWGILNLATFNNNTGGDIKIDNTTSIGLYNQSGTFNNVAKITIGATTSTGVDGLNNASTFNNNTGGQISINRATGLNSSGLNNASGTFTNAATINITNAGTSSTPSARDGAVGIRNQATFSNSTGGQININDLTGNNSTGIRNQSGTFNNEATINIGDLVIGGAFGIVNLAMFNNNTGGQLNIDRSTAQGVLNSSGTFTNAATITIGAKATVGANGIANQATFNNNTGGQINLDRSLSGIRQFSGTFNNAAKITTGASLVNNGIRNESTFNNNPCGEISTFHPLLNSSNFTNAGLFRENTTSAHTNSGTVTNNGIIEYPQGNPIPNVTNNDVIVAPITVCSTTTFSPALQIGGANSFTVGTTWYKEPALTNAAGTYSPNTFTVTNLTAGSTYPLYFEITDPVNMCTRTVGINVTVNAIPPTPIITGLTTFCTGSSVTLGSGSATGNQWYLDGNPIGGATNQTYTATAQGNYTVVVMASGCPSAPSAATTVNETTATLAINQDMATTNIVPGGNLIFGNDCRAIGVITPNGANPVSGNVDSKVWVQATQPSFNGRPYLKRHYEITPANNPNTATARVTLYATQAEFDAFNLFAFNGDDMPTGPGDNAGIANIRFYKYSGTSSDGSGSPGSYTQPGVLIDPVNSDIIWNSTLNRWEISFNVSGFSGFFGGNGGNTILPLQLLSFNGTKQANSSTLNWKTANEQNTKSFELESSTDGRRFTKMATLNAAGNGSHSYSYTDATIYKDKVWYRLKMLDADGKFTYSTLVLMNQSTNHPITIFPNPAISVLNINLSSAKLLNTNAQLTDAKGSLLQVVRLSGYNQPVTIGQLAKGMYLIKFADGTVLRFVKE